MLWSPFITLTQFIIFDTGGSLDQLHVLAEISVYMEVTHCWTQLDWVKGICKIKYLASCAVNCIRFTNLYVVSEALNPCSLLLFLRMPRITLIHPLRFANVSNNISCTGTYVFEYLCTSRLMKGFIRGTFSCVSVYFDASLVHKLWIWGEPLF